MEQYLFLKQDYLDYKAGEFNTLAGWIELLGSINNTMIDKYFEYKDMPTAEGTCL